MDMISSALTPPVMSELLIEAKRMNYMISCAISGCIAMISIKIIEVLYEKIRPAYIEARPRMKGTILGIGSIVLSVIFGSIFGASVRNV